MHSAERREGGRVGMACGDGEKVDVARAWTELAERSRSRKVKPFDKFRSLAIDCVQIGVDDFLNTNMQTHHFHRGVSHAPGGK